jgi:hypothetical protein
MLVDLANKYLRRLYKNGEKIDIVFIFQSASFWPSWESVWEECNSDERFNPIMLLSDDSFKEKTQFKTAREFLKKQNIDYKHVSEVNLSDINPHIVVLHTPYDGHRPRYLFGKRLSANGYRVVYITYGIEISDIKKARNDHFLGSVTTTAWRVYTFSKEMIPYYKMFSPTGGDMVRSFGHPKFDKLNKKSFPSLPEEILKKANGRKVLLFKVHFPKKVNGKIITPSLEMYEEFIKNFSMYKGLFCIFMPHPKFYKELEHFKDVNKFKALIEDCDNMIEYNDDDYRPVLMNCDYYMVDRSALMIEAGVTGKPILYLKAKVAEAMTAPVQKIIDSYYQASTYAEINRFMDEVVIPDEDPLKEERIKIFESIIPSMKGKSGYLIKEDMKNSLIKEEDRASNPIITEEFKELIKDLYLAEEMKVVSIEVEKKKWRNKFSCRVGKILANFYHAKNYNLLQFYKELKKLHKKYKLVDEKS